MRILLYGINFSPELTGVGKYTGEMARWLAARGHDVRMVTAPPYYPEWRVGDGFSAWRYDCRTEDGVRVIRCPLYVPSRPSPIRRLIHLFSFSVSSGLALLTQTFWKPDLVLQIVPTMFCTPQALLVAGLSGARSLLHIQDFEVDAFFGLSMGGGALLKRAVLATERFLLRRFDRVSTISEGMVRRAADKGVAPDRLRFFPNWSETGRFRDVPRDNRLLAGLGVDGSRRVILYSGNIGEKQGLEIVIEAARALASRTDLQFLIVGEGAGKTRLMELAQTYGLNNVRFAGLQPYEVLPSLLASADCHLVVQRRGAADAVLPSKLTNILAAGGNALITAEPETSLGQLCAAHPGIAVRVEPESWTALIEGIHATLAMPPRNRVATAYAAEFLDKETILERFLARL